MAKYRSIRMDRFNEKLADQVIGEDNLVKLELSKDDSVFIRLPIFLEEDDPFIKAMGEAQATGDQEEVARVVLSYHPDGVSAQDQLDLWYASGQSIMKLTQVFQAETEAGRERLGKFRYNG